MANIDTYIEQIRVAELGEEVRGSIINALVAENNESNTAYDAAIASQTSAQNSASAAASSATDAANSAALATNAGNKSVADINTAVNGAISTLAGYDTSARNSAYDASQSALAAKSSETNAKTSEQNAKGSEDSVIAARDRAITAETNAKTAETNAKNSETLALNAQAAAQSSATNAQQYASNALTSATTASNAQTAASNSASNAATSAQEAQNWARQAESIAGAGVATTTTPGFVAFDDRTIKMNANSQLYAAGFDEHVEDTLMQNLSNPDGVHGTRIYVNPTTKKRTLQALNAEKTEWVDQFTEIKMPEDGTITMDPDGTIHGASQVGYEILVTTTESTLFGKNVIVSNGSETVSETMPASGKITIKVTEGGTYTVSCGAASETVKTTYYGSYEVELTLFTGYINVTIGEVLGTDTITLTAVHDDGTVYTGTTQTRTGNIKVGKAGSYTVYGEVRGVRSSEVSAQIDFDGDSDEKNISFAILSLTIEYSSAASITISSLDGTKSFPPITNQSSWNEYVSTGMWKAVGNIDGEDIDDSIEILTYTKVTKTLSASSARIEIQGVAVVAPIMDITKYVYDYSTYNKPESVNRFSIQLTYTKLDDSTESEVKYFDSSQRMSISVNTKDYKKVLITPDPNQAFTVSAIGDLEFTIEAKQTYSRIITWTEKYAVLDVTKDAELLGDDVVLTWNDGSGDKQITHTADNVTDKSKFICKKITSYMVTCNTINKPIDIRTLDNGADPIKLKLETKPDGDTATPNSVETWVACGGLSSLGYTTMAQVLADQFDCLEPLMNDENAMKYLTRSTGFITDICGNEMAMTYLGRSAYCDTLLDNSSTWVDGISDSSYIEKVFTNLVVPMTSYTTDAQNTGASFSFRNYIPPVNIDNDTNRGWFMFDGNTENWWNQFGYDTPEYEFVYKFGKSFKKIYAIKIWEQISHFTFESVSVSSDGNNYSINTIYNKVMVGDRNERTWKLTNPITPATPYIDFKVTGELYGGSARQYVICEIKLLGRA